MSIKIISTWKILNQCQIDIFKFSYFAKPILKITMHKAINHCWHMHETSNVFMHICNFLISLWTFGGQLKLLGGQQLYYNSCLKSKSKGRLQIQVGWHQPGLNSPCVSTMVPHPTRLPTDDRAACLFTCFTRLRGMGVKATLSHYIVGDSMLNKIVVDHPPIFH